MAWIRRLLSGIVGLALVFGALALLTPAEAVARPGDDPNCRRACPPTKKHNGFTCTFAGCDPVTGDCLYAC